MVGLPSGPLALLGPQPPGFPGPCACIPALLCLLKSFPVLSPGSKGFLLSELLFGVSYPEL